ncbi:hypothetical protein [Streptomyces atratus]|uniref:hypothetical protein n=1 Tax=Streptomyces atratus TaxID=1893 RepID=UPI00340E50ED
MTFLGVDTLVLLTALAERNLRVTASGLESGIAPADERLRDRAREAVRTLRPH